jgi:YfiH family protein
MVSEAAPEEFLTPCWMLPAGVRALMTTRRSPAAIGHSRGAYAARDGSLGLNLGLGSGEDPQLVEGNRQRLASFLGIELGWLDQVHGCRVVQLGKPGAGAANRIEQADASWTDVRRLGLAVLVADCLPVLFADRGASVVAAAHAGWRGLAAGVLEATVRALPVSPDHLLAYLGPAIGPRDFEVGHDVFSAFVSQDARAASAFKAGRPGKWYGDLAQLARLRLEPLGVTVFSETASTYADPERYYSFRRDKVTGRMAALIWLE